MTRTGKIARLPLVIRETLNKRMADGVPSVDLMHWLNGLPEVRQVLREHFGGREINEQNISDWKLGGFADWELQEEMLACALNRAEDARVLREVTNGAMTEHLGTVLAARYAQLMAGWNGEMDEKFQRRLRGLHILCENITKMRREDARSARLNLDKDKRIQDEKKMQERALELCLEEGRKSPEVRAAFDKAFALLDEIDGRPPGDQKTGVGGG